MSKYTLSHGQTCSYLLDGNGFHVALSVDGPDTLQEIADKLNRLEALERSHAELVEVARLSRDKVHGGNLWMSRNLTDNQLQERIREALSRAQSLTSTTKTPTAGV